MNEFVSIVIVSWNSRANLTHCLPTVMVHSALPFELIVVDNASTDDSADFIQSNYPTIHLIRNRQNVGFAAAVNQGFAAARGDILIELNPDTTVAPNWLEPLVAAAQQPNVGLVNPRILLRDDPTRINACGNEMSLTGLTFCIGVGESAAMHTQSRPIPAISGAAFAITRDCYAATGGFDENYFTYFEDTDLSWRARLAGFEIVLAADSLVYHNYTFRMSPQKMYYLERNRYVTLLKCLRRRTLLRLLPALLLGELISWGFALLQGRKMLGAKTRSWIWIVRQRREIAAQHAAVVRMVDDRQIVAQMTPYLRFDQTLPTPLANWLTRLLTPPLQLNKWLALR